MTTPRPRRLMTMREALEDPEVFGDYLAGESWRPWRVILMASQGEPLTDDERAIYTTLTKREREPSKPVKEVWGVVGRRGGKTNAFAVAAAYFARLIDYTGASSPANAGASRSWRRRRNRPAKRSTTCSAFSPKYRPSPRCWKVSRRATQSD